MTGFEQRAEKGSHSCSIQPFLFHKITATHDYIFLLIFLFPLQLLFQGTGGVQRHTQRVDGWGNSEPDVCRRPALQRCDQLHPPAVVVPSADHLVHCFPVAGVGSVRLGRLGCHGAHGAHQWTARHQGQKIPGQQKCTCKRCAKDVQKLCKNCKRNQWIQQSIYLRMTTHTKILGSVYE